MPMRISRSWNEVDPMVEDSVKAPPGEPDTRGDTMADSERTWVQTSPCRSMLMPYGERTWLRLDDAFVQHQKPYWREIPQDLPDADISPNWEEEVQVPRPAMPEVHARECSGNWDTDRNQENIASEEVACTSSSEEEVTWVISMSSVKAPPGGDDREPWERPDPGACSVQSGLAEKTWTRIDKGVKRFAASKDGVLALQVTGERGC
eukprot:6480698-Amphidinium_carterae.2